MVTLVFGIIILLLALFGEPLFIIIGAITLLCFAGEGQDLGLAIVSLTRIVDIPALLAIPLFTFAGYLLASSNTPKRLLNLSKALFGQLPGGISIVSLLACAIFTAFTGGSGMTIVALGGLILPMLLKEHYPEKFSLGLVTTGGSLGLLFPPSLPIIIYALIAQQASQQVTNIGVDTSQQIISINKLFIAGIIPGVLIIIMLSIYGFYKARKEHILPTKFSFINLWIAVKEAAWEIPLPFIIIFGIYWGIITATEAAVIIAFYVFVVEIFIYKDLKLTKDVPKVIKESMMLVGAILVILGCSLGLTDYLIFNEAPQKLFSFIQTYIDSKMVFLLLLNVFLLFVGMIESFSAIIIVVPIIVPIALSYGINPIHLGIIFLLNLEIGYLMPPVGVNLFISSYRFERPMLKIYQSVLPFIGILLIALILVTYIPSLSLFLVELFKVQ